MPRDWMAETFRLTGWQCEQGVAAVANGTNAGFVRHVPWKTNLDSTLLIYANDSGRAAPCTSP